MKPTGDELLGWQGQIAQVGLGVLEHVDQFAFLIVVFIADGLYLCHCGA